MSIWVHHQHWITPARRAWWSLELVRDLAEESPNAYHKFLWAHHLGYAAPYEVESRFGTENMRASRLVFFDELRKCLEASGIPVKEVRSVLEVGCSLGYQLRYFETEFLPWATRLEGIDIDDYAVRAGQEYLTSIGSRVSLLCGDILELDSLIDGNAYDLILCTGVLMYMTQKDAARLVRIMLSSSRTMVALAGLAHPDVDNALLACSDVRERDHTFVHNFDDMVQDSGGRVLARRWDGARQVEGQSVYFVFAAPR